MIDAFRYELRHAARALLRAPVYAASILATLALAFAGSVAIYGVLHAVLLRPLPFPRPEALVVVESRAARPETAVVAPGVSHPNFLDLERAARSFSGLAAFTMEAPTLSAPDAPPTQVRSAAVTAGFLETAGVRPLLGRGIAPAEDRPDAPRVVVLGHDVWATRYGGDPAVLGRRIVLDETPHTVVGVMPRGFAYPARAQLWTALGVLPGTAMRGMHGLQVWGRLRDPRAIGAANAELRTFGERLAREHPRENSGRTLAATPLHDSLVGDARATLLALLGAMGLLWSIACLNVAGLVLARTLGRARLTAVRIALGGSPRRVAGAHFAEGGLLAIVAAAAGVALAPGAMRLLHWLVPPSITPPTFTATDPAVLVALAVLVAIAVGVLGAVPALATRRVSAGAALRGTSTGLATSALDARLGRGLVVAELAMAVVLLLGTALLGRSLQRLHRVDLGFDPRRVVVAPLRLPPGTYGMALDRVRAFYRELLAQAGTIPGVEAASIALAHPLQTGFSAPFRLERADPGGQEQRARLRAVSAGYFRTAGLRVLQGRDIEPTDLPGRPGAAVVNEAFVREFLRDRPALGQSVLRRSFTPGAPERFEIVGVVENERFGGPRAPAEPALYVPFEQVPFASANLVLRMRGAELPDPLIAGVRERVWALDPAVPVESVRPLEDHLAEAVTTPSSVAALVAAFAALALLLAALGLYGVLAFTASARRRDFAVRLALGASPDGLLRRMVLDGVAMTALGIAAGLVCGASAARLLAPLLFEVGPTDARACATVAALLLVVGAAAAFVPALRVARVPPMLALRGDD